MKILHITDLHFQEEHFQWVLDNQHQAEAICLTGDLLNTHLTCDTPEVRQIDIIQQWSKSITTPLFICSGNHDEMACNTSSQSLAELFSLNDNDQWDDDHVDRDTGWLMELSSQTVFVDHSIHSLNGLTFGCIPYGTDDFYRFNTCDVVLHHVPPAQTLTSQYDGQDFGCSRIREALTAKVIKPRWLLSGHIHRPTHIKDKVLQTWIYNPGSSRKSNIPKHFIFEIN